MKASNAVMFVLFCAMNLVASSQMVTSDITTNTTWDADTVFVDRKTSPFKTVSA